MKKSWPCIINLNFSVEFYPFVDIIIPACFYCVIFFQIYKAGFFGFSSYLVMVKGPPSVQKVLDATFKTITMQELDAFARYIIILRPTTSKPHAASAGHESDLRVAKSTPHH